MRSLSRLRLKNRCHYGGLLNNMNSPNPREKRFAAMFKPSFQLASFLPAREVVGKPRPLAYRIVDPHSQSSNAVKQVKTPRRPLVSGFKSAVYLGQARYTSTEPAEDSLLQGLSPVKVHTLLKPFPMREHRGNRLFHSQRPLKPILSPISSPSALRRAVEITQTRACLKLEMSVDDDMEEKTDVYDSLLLHPKYA